MVDCRSLIEFCRTFEQHRHMTNSQASSDHRSGQSRRKSKSLNPPSHSLCELTPFAAIDVVMLLLVLGALAGLTVPDIKLIFREAYDLLPAAIDVMGDVLYDAPIAYVAGLVFMFVTVVAAWEFFNYQARKCGNPYCKGLRKAVDFDIQLETEACVRCLPPLPTGAFGTHPLNLGGDQKELEAELKKMAPPTDAQSSSFALLADARQEEWRFGGQRKFVGPRSRQESMLHPLVLGLFLVLL